MDLSSDSDKDELHSEDAHVVYFKSDDPQQNVEVQLLVEVCKQNLRIMWLIFFAI